MRLLNSIKEHTSGRGIPYAGLALGLVLLLWPVLQRMLQWADETAGALDPNIWLLVLLGIAVFLLLLSVAWCLLQQYWLAFGLPAIELMVLQFNGLELWQQLKFYYALFALLLLVGVGCLAAVL